MGSDLSGAEWPLEIDAISASKLLQEDGDVLLIDCRTPQEYAIARIDRAVLMPMDELPARLSELEPFRGQRIVVHCHHGGRSLVVTQRLRKLGFSATQNMSGGIDAWSQLVDAQVPRY